MKTVLTTVLCLANVLALICLFSLCSPSQAATQLTIDDLYYGAMDLDGDGQYTLGDDLTIESIYKANPRVIEDALTMAKVNPDGGVDLSPFMNQFGLHGDEITLYRNGQIVTQSVDSCKTK